jgi:tRNA nucleotidyltransferase (CCA-adding enzyme)
MTGARGRRALTPRTVAGAFRRSLPEAVHNVLAAVGKISCDSGWHAYLVGGIVRDIAIGYRNTDLDLMIEGDAERVARRFADQTRGRFLKPTEFGTCKVETDDLGTLDFAAARTETYRRPGALPEVACCETERDLWRRDFTINALAISLAPGTYGEVTDPCGGIDDLRLGRLRVMHDASFLDDPTRILRGVRFAARYGYRFEAHTLQLLRSCLASGCLKTISGKRVSRELLLLCREPRARDGLRMLEDLGILASLGLEWNGAGRRHLLWRGIPQAITALGAVGAADLVDAATCWFVSIFAWSGLRGTRQAERLNLPRELRRPCAWAATELARAERRLASMDRKQAYRVTLALNAVPSAGLVLLYAASALHCRRLVASYLSDWRHVKPRVSGGDVAAMGAGPGPNVRRLLDRIMRLRLDGHLPTRQDEIEYLKRAIPRLR